MISPGVVWLASYPRSGNTFLRTILWQCFGLRSASIYPKDLGSKKALEDYVGHIEHVDGQSDFAADMRAMAADPETKRWWALMEPMQQKWPSAADHEWWSTMTEVFHCA